MSQIRPSTAPPAATKDTWRKSVLRGVLAGLVTSVLICAGVAALLWAIDCWVSRQVDTIVSNALQPALVQLDFSMELSVGNSEAAYGLTTEGFRRQNTLAKFAEMVEQHPELRAPWDENEIEEQTEDLLVYRVRAKTYPEFRLKLRRERGRWGVEQIVFP